VCGSLTGAVVSDEGAELEDDFLGYAEVPSSTPVLYPPSHVGAKVCLADLTEDELTPMALKLNKVFTLSDTPV
jgi:hypothetical protein